MWWYCQDSASSFTLINLLILYFVLISQLFHPFSSKNEGPVRLFEVIFGKIRMLLILTDKTYFTV